MAERIFRGAADAEQTIDNNIVTVSSTVAQEAAEVADTVAFLKDQFAVGRMSRRAYKRNINEVLGIPGHQ